MNEALFYSAAGLDRLFNEVRKFEKQNMEISVYNEFLGLVEACPTTAKTIFGFITMQTAKKSAMIRCTIYTVTASHALPAKHLKDQPEKKDSSFSRSSCIGMHRYAGIWMGDNKSWWSHLLMNLKMLPSLNMVGILYTGADIGGFGADATEDLFSAGHSLPFSIR